MPQASRHAGRHFVRRWCHGAQLDLDVEQELAEWARQGDVGDVCVEAEFGVIARPREEGIDVDRYDSAQRLYDQIAREPEPPDWRT